VSARSVSPVCEGGRTHANCLLRHVRTLPLVRAAPPNSESRPTGDGHWLQGVWGSTGVVHFASVRALPAAAIALPLAVRGELAARKDTTARGVLLEIPFRTVGDYLHLLREAGLAADAVGPRVMFLLAAAVGAAQRL
jgi:hypothetical protein